MPDKMVVNVPPYEGEYDFELEKQPFNTDEWEWLYNISGYLPLTMDKGWQGGDPRLFLAFAVVAMNRSGKIKDDEIMEVAALLRKAPVDGTAIAFKGAAVEAVEADPPQQSSPDDSSSDSGESSSESSEASPESEAAAPSGIQDWVTGSDSDRLTLAK